MNVSLLSQESVTEITMEGVDLDSIHHKSGVINNSRYQSLATSFWAPRHREPTAVLLFVHGLGDHSGRYDYFYARLANAGIAVHSFDLHGHGNSQPKNRPDRQVVKKFEHLLDDTKLFVADVATQYQNSTLPTFMAGHREGALVATLMVLQYQAFWDGLLLLSADVDFNKWNARRRLTAPFIKVLAYTVPKVRVVKAVNPEYISQDVHVVRDYVRDRHTVLGKMPAVTGYQRARGYKMLRGRESELYIPILGVHGDRDRVSSFYAHKRLIDLASSATKTLHQVPDGHHDLLNGPEKQAVVDQIISWVLRRSTSDDD